MFPIKVSIIQIKETLQRHVHLPLDIVVMFHWLYLQFYLLFEQKYDKKTVA